MVRVHHSIADGTSGVAIAKLIFDFEPDARVDAVGLVRDHGAVDPDGAVDAADVFCGGTLPDGSEMELDMTQIDGVWTVVEFQRDIGMELVPEDVVAVLADGVPGWTPTRIIESDQGDGTIIYEFFAPGSGDELDKHEVKWTDGVAELLVDEWAH